MFLKKFKNTLYKDFQNGSIKLDVGCGDVKPKKGFYGVDIRSFPWVKFKCNAWDIGKHIKPNSVEEIYSRHFMEHLTFPQTDLFLAATYLILRPKGTINIIVPDISYHIKQFLIPDRSLPSETNPKWTLLEHAQAGFWGWQREGDKNFWDVHKSGYDYPSLEKKLTENGFVKIIHIADDPWNLNVKAEKP